MRAPISRASSSTGGGLRRLLVLVSAVVLVDVMFYSAITPLLPSYVDDLDLSKSQAGLLSGAYAIGTFSASLPAGWLALRFGARRTLLAGLVLLAVSCVAFGLAHHYGLLVAARLLQGVGGAGSWAAGLAWLMAVAPRERRGQLIGTALGTAIAGSIGGPVLGALARLISTEVVFSAVAVVALALAAAIAAIPEDAAPQTGGRLAGALREPRVLVGAWLTMLPALFFGTFGVLTALRLDVLGVGAAGIAGVFLGTAAVEAAVSPAVGRLSDRRGRLLPLQLGLAGVVVAAAALPLPAIAWLLAVVALGASAVAGMLSAPAMALLSDGADASGLPQSVAFGVVNLAWAGGQVGGSAGGAALADATSDGVPYAVHAVLAAATLAALVAVRSADGRRRRASASAPAAGRSGP